MTAEEAGGGNDGNYDDGGESVWSEEEGRR